MNLHEIRMAGIRAAEDAVVRDLEKSGLAALTGAQPAPAAPSDIHLTPEEAAFLAARLRRLFEHFDYALPIFAVNDASLIRIAGSCIGALLANAAAPAAQPADIELLEALEGMLAIEASVTQGQERELKEKWLPKAKAVAKAVRQQCDRARTLSAASNKEIDRGL